MISLYNTLKESLLGNFEDIEASADPKKEIEEFIKDNYRIWGALQISKEPNNDGKYEVSCKEAEVTKRNITSLTNELFIWLNVQNNFDCSFCEKLTSLKGAPKYVGGNFDCGDCNSLTTLEGAPEEVGGWFGCCFCKKLTSLEGAPKKLGGTFNCSNCGSLKSLEGVPKEIKKAFGCSFCKSLTSLEGAPEKVSGDFSCADCRSLTSLEGAPKEVDGSFSCFGCKQDFTEEDVRKVCDVEGFIYTK